MNHEIGGVEEGEVTFVDGEWRVDVTQLRIGWNVPGDNWTNKCF